MSSRGNNEVIMTSANQMAVCWGRSCDNDKDLAHPATRRRRHRSCSTRPLFTTSTLLVSSPTKRPIQDNTAPTRSESTKTSPNTVLTREDIVGGRRRISSPSPPSQSPLPLSSPARPSSAPTFFSQPARHPTPIGAPRPTVHHEPLSQRLMDWMVARSNAVPAYPVRATAPVTRCTLQDGRQEPHSHTRTAAAAARVAVVRVRVTRACISSDAVATSSQWGNKGERFAH